MAPHNKDHMRALASLLETIHATGEADFTYAEAFQFYQFGSCTKEDWSRCLQRAIMAGLVDREDDGRYCLTGEGKFLGMYR